MRIPENTERVRAAIGRSPKDHYVDIQLPSTYRAVRSDGYFNMIYIFIPTNHILCKNCQTVILLQEVYFVSNCFSTFPNENPGVIRHLKVSEEAHFELSGCVNKQRVRYWNETNPHEACVKQIQSESNSVVWDISVRHH